MTKEVKNEKIKLIMVLVHRHMNLCFPGAESGAALPIKPLSTTGTELHQTTGRAQGGGIMTLEHQSEDLPRWLIYMLEKWSTLENGPSESRSDPDIEDPL